MRKRLLLDPPQLSLVLCLEGPQGVPTYQPLIPNLFYLTQALPSKVIKIKEWAQIGTPGILLPVVLVFKVAAGDLGTEAEVEGIVTSLGGQGGVVTLNQGNLVLPMYPLVGMEATKETAEGGGGTRLDA